MFVGCAECLCSPEECSQLNANQRCYKKMKKTKKGIDLRAVSFIMAATTFVCRCKRKTKISTIFHVVVTSTGCYKLVCRRKTSKK